MAENTNEQPKQSVPGKPFSIRFPAEMWERLTAYAQEDERTLSGMVVWILRRYIAYREREAKQHDDGAAWRR